jgi:hypothetical protein
MEESLRKKFGDWTSTKQRRHNFYCTSTISYTQETAIFALCVIGFKQSHKKRQAALLRTWFVDAQIPSALAKGGYISPLNISSDLAATSKTSINAAVDAVGKTFLNKVKNHGGGLRGLAGAINQKYGDATGVDPRLFDELLTGTLPEMFAVPAFANSNPDHVQQPNGNFADQIQTLKRHLREADFNPDDLGIY